MFTQTSITFEEIMYNLYAKTLNYFIINRMTWDSRLPKAYWEQKYLIESNIIFYLIYLNGRHKTKSNTLKSVWNENEYLLPFKMYKTIKEKNVTKLVN